jgi:hypothetical protein
VTQTTPPDQSVHDLIAHLNTTDASIDPCHANSIMKMAAAQLEHYWKLYVSLEHD